MVGLAWCQTCALRRQKHNCGSDTSWSCGTGTRLALDARASSAVGFLHATNEHPGSGHTTSVKQHNIQFATLSSNQTIEYTTFSSAFSTVSASSFAFSSTSALRAAALASSPAASYWAASSVHVCTCRLARVGTGKRLTHVLRPAAAPGQGKIMRPSRQSFRSTVQYRGTAQNQYST